MQVLILDDDPARTAGIAGALAARGMQVLCAETPALAGAMVRLGLPDLMILNERVGGRLSHPVALLAACREPAVPVIFLTTRNGAEAAELFELIPSACSLAGPATPPETLAGLALAALEGRPVTPAQVPGGRLVPVAAQGGGTGPVAAAAGGRGDGAGPGIDDMRDRREPAGRAARALALARLPARRPALTLA